MTIFFIILFVLHHSSAFCLTNSGIPHKLPTINKQTRFSTSSSFSGTSQNNNKSALIGRLQTLIKRNDEIIYDSNDRYITQEEIKQVISNLEKEYAVTKTDHDDISRFEPLIGYYNVSYVQSVKENDNPVGGKWTRNNNRVKRQLIHTRRTLQHILPVNTTGLMNRGDKRSVVAEAVNVISLDVFWKLIRLSVILRGDAKSLSKEERDEIQNKRKDVRSIQPTLSNLAVRAYFDPPRIIVGKSGRFFNFQIGPPSSVVLDTSYIDEKVRIGVGGTSGTRFVFKKCSEDDNDAKEFFSLLQRRPMNRSTLLAFLGCVIGVGVRSIMKGTVLSGGAITVMGLLATTAVAFSTGGIENDNGDNLKEAMK